MSPALDLPAIEKAAWAAGYRARDVFHLTGHFGKVAVSRRDARAGDVLATFYSDGRTEGDAEVIAQLKDASGSPTATHYDLPMKVPNCRVCGLRAQVYQRDTRWRIQCPRDTTGPMFDTAEEALAAWREANP